MYLGNERRLVPCISRGGVGVAGGDTRLTKAGLVVLGEAGGTAAGEGADSVGAEELAVVLPGGALVQVCGTDGPHGLRAGTPVAGGFPGERPQGWHPMPRSGEGMRGRGHSRGIPGGLGMEPHRAWGGRHLCRSCRPPPAGSLGGRRTGSCPRCFCRGRHMVWGPGRTHLYLEGRQGVRQMFPETQGPGVSAQALTN